MTIKEVWRKFIDGDKDGKETEFLPSILEVTETPPSPVGRLVLWTIVALLVIAAIWSILGKVDEVAVANGKIIPVGQVKVVQSSNKGVIKKLYVKEGQLVKKGEPLVELDTTKTKADVDQMTKQVAYYKMTMDRLNAEMEDKPFIPPTAKNVSQDDINAQVALYTSRRQQLEASLDKMDKTIAQESASIAAAQVQKEEYTSLYQISLEREGKLEELYKNNAVALFQVLEERAKRIQYQKTAQAQDEDIKKEQAKLAEAQEAKSTAVADYKKEVMTNLVDARKQYNAYNEELKKANETNQQSLITAPVSGRINQLSVHTVGGVVSEGQALMMVVPDDVVMQVEAWADNKDIGFIKVGQKASVKVESFDFQKYGMVDATVEEISPDAISNSQDKEKNNKYRLTLTIDKPNDQIKLSPGMNVATEIKIRKKKIIDFFLDPFRQYKDEALRER